MKFQRRLYKPYIFIADVILEDSDPAPRVSRWRLVGECWQSLLTLLLGKSEPIIEQYSGDNGQTVYSVYDPFTEQRLTGLSETEVRVWLEQRYSQNL